MRAGATHQLMSRRRPRTLANWFKKNPQPMSKRAFARALGVSPSYVSQLTKDAPPWPGRELAVKIAEVTGGYVQPNDLAGWPAPKQAECSAAE
jgi:transcriptional regulator with XRE-family HTH domain